MAKKPKRGKATKGKKSPLRIDSDDIIDLVEVLVDEATPVGFVKRTALKISKKISAKYINKIDELSEENETLVKTISEMSKTTATVVKFIDKQDAEIADLKSKLQKLRKKQKITPKQ